MSKVPKPLIKVPLPVGLVIGLSAAVVLNVLAILMGGAGHGVSTPVSYSLPTLIAFPLLGWLAWLAPCRKRRVCSLALIAAAVVANAGLAIGLHGESYYFDKVLDHGFLFVAAWFLIWGGAQLLALLIVVGSPNSRNSD